MTTAPLTIDYDSTMTTTKTTNYKDYKSILKIVNYTVTYFMIYINIDIIK